MDNISSENVCVWKRLLHLYSMTPFSTNPTLLRRPLRETFECHSQNVAFSLMPILNVDVAKTSKCDVTLASWHFPENTLALKGLKSGKTKKPWWDYGLECCSLQIVALKASKLSAYN